MFRSRIPTLLRYFSKQSDFYKILQVPLSASQQQIKSSYHKLAKKYHPDYNPTTQQLFKNINLAYETLGDPQKRLQYDSQRVASYTAGNPTSRTTYTTNYRNFYYGSVRRSRHSANTQSHTQYHDRPKDTSYFYNEYINPKDSAFDQQIRQSIRRQQYRARRTIFHTFVFFMASLFVIQTVFAMHAHRNQYQLYDPVTDRRIHTDKQTYHRILRQQQQRKWQLISSRRHLIDS